MELFTALPARKDGTLKVTVPDGTAYTFKGEPLGCVVEDEDHQDHLQALGFMNADDFEAEQDFIKRNAEREAKRSARGLPPTGGASAFAPDDDEPVDQGDGLPKEADSKPTGRVRRSARASNVTG